MAKHRPQLIEYMGNHCVRCKKSVQEMVERYGTIHRVFKFHHVHPDEKSGNYKNLMERKLCTEQLDELDKCILLCGECHDILHAQDVDGEIHFQVEIDGKAARQTLSGNFVFDAKDHTATFLTNQYLYVQPYLMTIGIEKQEPQLVFGTELIDGLLVQKLSQLRETTVMKLFDFRTREQLFQASFTDNETVIFEFDLSLNIPFFVNPLVKDTGSEVKWVRHGIALKDDGEIMTSGVAKIEHTNPTFLANGE